MALIPTLTLKDSTTFSDEVNFSVTDSLAVIAPSRSLSLETVTTTGANHIIIPASTATAFLFVRHTGTTDGSTGTAQWLDLENTDNEAFARLGAGEWLFMPFSHGAVSVGVQLQSVSGNIQVEYAYWSDSVAQ